MNFRRIKKSLYKLIITVFISVSIISGPIASYEMEKIIKHLSGYEAEIKKELEEEELEAGESKNVKRRKKHTPIL